MKSSRETIRLRQNKILHILQSRGRQSVNYLAERLEVTPATIRRDLDQMEQAGCIIRSFGYAEYFAPHDMKDIEPTDIEDEKALIRRRIAKAAADMVEDGDVLFINSSGTASLVLEYLSGKHVTVLTNNARIINRPHVSNVDVLLVGGEIYGKKQSLIGQFALDTISRVVATKCILGVSGISVEGGLTSVILPETQINISMLEQCNGEKIVVADSSKVGVTQNFYSGSLSSITCLVTDSGAEAHGLQAIADAGVRIVRV